MSGSGDAAAAVPAAFPPRLRNSVRPLGSVPGISRSSARRLRRTYGLSALADVIGADGRALVPIHDDENLKEIVSEAVEDLLASVSKVVGGSKGIVEKCQNLQLGHGEREVWKKCQLWRFSGRR